MSARLTAHVLDTALGRPAPGVLIQVRRDGRVAAEAKTNQDGRTPSPLLENAAFPAGAWEILFHAGEYFRRDGRETFWEVVSVRFSADGSGHYHIPLLLSPFGCSVYRGS